MQHTIEAAVLCDGLLKIESLKIEGPRDDEVLVRMVASGICRTDLDFLGDSMILGHEGAGVAEIVGVRLILPMTFIVDSIPPSGVPYTLKADLREEAAFANAAKGIFSHSR